jgi:hypothetical protein
MTLYYVKFNFLSITIIPKELYVDRVFQTVDSPPFIYIDHYRFQVMDL